MTDKIYLKGINGLRAIAALSVVVFHINHSLPLFNLPKGSDVNLAGFGVTIFFAISGFLITHLLLKEKDNQPINIKNFYVRRILRIWPLYFLVLGISVVTTFIYSPSIFQEVKLHYVFLIFLAANIPFILGINTPLLGHYWSLGVEEQFYIFWPWVVKKTKNTFRFVLLFTLSFILLRLFFRFVEYKYDYSLPYTSIQVTRFDCMSIGAIGALLLEANNLFFLKLIMNKITQLCAWLVIVLLMFNKYHIASVIDQEIVGIVTVVLIINLSQNKQTLINLDTKLFDFIGKISFGIYMYHQLVIFYVAKFFSLIEITLFLKYPLIYVFIIGVTIGIAYLSYEFFEKKILRLKVNYSAVKSINSKKEYNE